MTKEWKDRYNNYNYNISFLVIITNLDNAILSKIANPFTKITMSVQSGIVYAKINYQRTMSILQH